MEEAELSMTYVRLREELARAYSAQTWRSEEIDRLANDIAVVEAEIARLPASHASPTFAWNGRPRKPMEFTRL